MLKSNPNGIVTADAAEQRCPSIWRGALAGAVGGIAGSFAMDAFSRIWTLASRRKLSRREEDLSRQGGRPDVEHAKKSGRDAEDRASIATTKMADALAESMGKPLSPRQRIHGGTAIHYVYGAAMGALYGAGSEVFPALRKGRGVGYGLMLWLGATEIALPLIGLSKKPNEYSRDDHLFSAASHVIYGWATDIVRNQLAARRT